MLFYPAALPLSSPTLKYTASLIRRHRARIGSPWRKLNPAQQALLVLAYLRKGETFADLAAGFGIGTATAWRYVTQTAGAAGRPLTQAARGTGAGHAGGTRLPDHFRGGGQLYRRWRGGCRCPGQADNDGGRGGEDQINAVMPESRTPDPGHFALSSPCVAFHRGIRHRAPCGWVRATTSCPRSCAIDVPLPPVLSGTQRSLRDNRLRRSRALTPVNT